MATATKPKRKSKPRPKSARNEHKPRFWSYEKDYDKFRGEYIATDGDRILAHGVDARVVLKVARQYAENPTLEMVIPLRGLY